MSTTHTPGPFWMDDDFIRSKYDVVGVVCDVGDATAANKALFTSSPQLLAVAQLMLKRGYVSKHIEEERADHELLVAAIAAATGGAA